MCDGACPICVSAARCCSDDGHAVLQCNSQGTARDPLETCPANTLCLDGACVEPCANAASANGYEGCEFYATNTINAALGHGIPGQDRDSFPFAVVVTNAWPVTAHVVVESRTLAATISYDVAPHDARRIDLPWNLALAEGNDFADPHSARVTGGAFHLRSDLPVAAYQFNPANYFMYPMCEGAQCYSYTNDASLLLPVASLRSQYLVVTRATVRVRAAGNTSWSTSSGFVTIVGTRDGTSVTLRSRARTMSGIDVAAADPETDLHANLDAGDVLQVLSFADRTCVSPETMPGRGDVFCTPVTSEDLTGSVVESDAPVAVFAGHDCALVPYNRFACDHLEEQLFPVESLGSRYVVAPTPPEGTEPNLVRVVAVRAGTTVMFDPPSTHDPVTFAQRGDSIEFELRAPVVIQANDAVEVAQFLVGASYDLANVIRTNGDPDMVLVPPVDQFRPRYEFLTARDFRSTTAVIVAPAGEPVLFDGVPITTEPAFRLAGYEVFYRRQLQGPHRVEALHPGARIGLTVSGLDNYCSYTYPGGLDLTPISPPL
jgi:hypothetical protein